MTTRRNFLWPVLIILIGVTMLLVALGILPENSDDLLQRAWPVLLVLFGLNMLLAERVRFGNWLSLGVAVALVGGVTVFAYSNRVNELRDDYVEAVGPVELGENIQGMVVNVETENVRVIFRHNDLWDDNTTGAQFIGSRESDVSIVIQEDDAGILNVTITENRPNVIPNLRDVGRGELEVYLPIGTPINELNFTNRRGPSTLDFRNVNIPRFDVVNVAGDMNLLMPRFGTVIGDVTIEEGNLNLEIPPDIPLRVIGAPSGNRRALNPNDYLSLEGGVIETRGGFTAFQVDLRVDLGEGTINITDNINQ